MQRGNLGPTARNGRSVPGRARGPAWARGALVWGSSAVVLLLTLPGPSGAAALHEPALLLTRLPPAALVFTITSFTGSADPGEVGLLSTFSIVVSGATEPVSFLYSGLPPGCSTANSSTLPCVPGRSGIFHLNVTASEPSGSGSTAPLTWTVNSRLQLSPITFRPAVLDAEAPERMSVNATGGVPPYLYGWTNMPRGCPATAAPVVTCRPDDPGAYSIVALVTDALGVTVTSTGVMVVDTLPVAVLFLVIPANITLGQSATFVSAVVGGTGAPLAYSYVNMPPGCASANLSALSCTPSAAGRFAVTMIVHDPFNGTSERTTNLTVSSLAIPIPQVLAFLAFPANLTAGSDTTLVAVIVGGSGGWMATYSGLPPGCKSAPSLMLNCRPGTPGTYPIVLQAVDTRGHIAWANLTLRVAPLVPPAGPAGPAVAAGTLLTWNAAGVALGAVAGAAVTLWALRRGGKSVSGRESAEGSGTTQRVSGRRGEKTRPP